MNMNINNDNNIRDNHMRLYIFTIQILFVGMGAKVNTLQYIDLVGSAGNT